MRRNLLWLIVACVLLTGCWDQKELSTIAIVTGIAVDKGKSGRFKLTVAGINAAELNEQTATGNSPSAVYSLEGDTVGELSQKMNIAFSKNLIYSHMKVFVASKEIAKEGMFDFLDFFERSRELRDDFFVVIAKEGEAKDILQIPSILQKDSALKLEMQIKQGEKIWGLTPAVQLDELVSAITSPGRQPVMTTIRIEGDEKKVNRSII